MTRSCKKIDESLISSGFLDSFDNVFSDIDGVLWLGNDAIPGSVETIQALHKLGKKIVYVTNNSTKAREDYLKVLEKRGYPAALEDIFPSSYCIAAYLKAQNFTKKAYIIGCSGIVNELEIAGIESLPIGDDVIPDDWVTWSSELKLEPGVGAVVVAFDHHVSHAKFTKAASYLKDPKCLFIAANRDEQFPCERLILPGAGTYVAAVEAATGRKSINVGKPSRHMIECIMNEHPEIDLERTIMVGDRLNSDIILGTSNGLKTLFVLTGINSLEDVERMKKSTDKDDKLQVPDYYLPCLGDLKKLMKT